MEKLSLYVFVSLSRISVLGIPKTQHSNTPTLTLAWLLDFSECSSPNLSQNPKCHMWIGTVPIQLWFLRKVHCSLRDPGKEGDGCRCVWERGRWFRYGLEPLPEALQSSAAAQVTVLPYGCHSLCADFLWTTNLLWTSNLP